MLPDPVTGTAKKVTSYRPWFGEGVLQCNAMYTFIIHQLLMEKRSTAWSVCCAVPGLPWDIVVIRKFLTKRTAMDPTVVFSFSDHLSPPPLDLWNRSWVSKSDTRSTNNVAWIVEFIANPTLKPITKRQTSMMGPGMTLASPSHGELDWPSDKWLDRKINRYDN